MADTNDNDIGDQIEAIAFANSIEQAGVGVVANKTNNEIAHQVFAFAKHVGIGVDIAAIAYAGHSQGPAAAFNETVDTLISNGTIGIAGAMAFELGPFAAAVGISAGAGMNLLLHEADINWFAPVQWAYDLTNQEPELGTLSATYQLHNGGTYKKVLDLSTNEVTYFKNSAEIARTTVDANGKPQQLAVSKAGASLQLDFVTGDYQVSGPSGSFSGNLTDSTIPSGASSMMGSMMNALDSDFEQIDPNFAGISSLFPDLEEVATGYIRVQHPDQRTYVDGDFRYSYSTTSANFELHYNGVHATYDASGVQTLILTDADTGISYLLQAHPDGTKYFSYTGHPGVIKFENAGEMPDHAMGAYQTFETKLDQAAGDKIREFFDEHPSESANTSSIIANFLNDPNATLPPPIPGRKPPAPGQEESAENGVTYEISEERSIIIDGQTFYLQQFSGRVDVDTLSNDRLVQYVRGDYAGYQVTQNDDVRFRAMAEFYQRWTDDPNNLIADGYSFVDATNGGAMSKVLVHGQTAYGAMTLVTKGAFKILTIETIGVEGVPDSVQIVTQDTTTGTGARSEPIKINYPEDFNFTYLGGFFGGLLAEQLDDGNVFKGVLYKTLLGTAGQTMGTFLDVLTADGGTAGATWAATNGLDIGIHNDIPALKARLAENFTSALASVIGNAISDSLTDAVDIGGIGGEVLEVGLDTVTVGVVNEILNMSFRGLEAGAYTQLFNAGFNFDAPFKINGVIQTTPEGEVITIGEHIEAQVLNAIAAYAGARLAGEIISPESQQAALFGSIGSGLATAIATGALKAGAAMQQLVTLGTIGLGPVGIAVAAFVGTVVGTFLGNALFGEEDNPAAWSKIVYDAELNAYVIDSTWSMDHGSPVVASQMAQSAVDGLNAIIEASGGTLRQGSHAPEIMIGYEGAEFRATLGGSQIYSFSTAADAVLQAAFASMKQFDLVGGYAVLMRAWHNSDAESIHEWKEDLDVAAAFQAYLADPTGIVALMLDQPESAGAQAWAAILNRAAELELHLPHERDLDGGWSEVLRARGDIDPDLIPDIEGGDIIMTDPVTGEEIRLEHVIGPGYEIVRIPGTDGNDIIQIVVDGPSITYVDAGAGDDIINGTEQADILVGGAGDDTVNGHGGNDWLHGGQGDDTLDGGAGEDLVVGGPNNDAMIGGDQNDTMYGSDGDDVIQGGDGKDFLYGGNGNDVLNGNDDIYGNKLYGEAGNDTLYGEGGDNLFGGLGNDTYYAHTGDRVTISRGTGHDVVYGSSSLNYITFDKTISLNELWFQRSGADLIIKILGEDQSVTIKNIITNNQTGYKWNIVSEAIDVVMEGSYYGYHSDTGFLAAEAAINQGFSLTGTNIISDASIALRDLTDYPNTTQSAWSKRFTFGWQSTTEAFISSTGYVGAWPNFTQDLDPNGSGGADLSGPTWSWLSPDNLFGRDIAETIHVNGGDDTVFASAGNDSIVDHVTWNDIAYDNRHISDDRIYADSGDDYVHAGFGEDLVVGGLGNDTIYGGDGNDEIYGGAGNDFLSGGGGPNITSNNNILHGGQGSDTVWGGNGNDQLYGDEGDDTILDDYTTGNNVMHGGAGNDQLLATGAGANTLYGEDGNDLLESFTGQDSLSGGAGNDILRAGAGNDMLFGDDGDDDLEGEDGDDKLSGGSGSDTLDGGDGDDTIFGGDGDDIFVHTFAENTAGTTDQYDAGEGNNDALRVYLTTAETALPHVLADLLRFKTTMAENQALGTATISFWMAALGLMASNFESLEVYIDGTLQNVAYNQINGTSAGETLSGASGHDYILGDAGDDTLTGGTGDDYLRGGEGADAIDAGPGFNYVKGDAGNDQIIGGEEQDRIEGGTGNDVITANGGDDHVEGQDGDDQLSGGNGADALIGGLGDDNLTGGEDDDTLSGQGDDDTLEGQAGNDILDGGSGNDQLLGGEGDDKLTGGEGHDTLRGGLGLNELTGGNGADIFTWSDGDIDGLIDLIHDFKIVQGDTLDFNGLLDFGTGDLISDFVRLTENGDDTDLALDADGTDNGVNFTTIGRLKNTTDLDTVAELFANGRITVTNSNAAPVAQDDEFAGPQDETIAGNLLVDNGNGADSDPDMDAIDVQPGTFTTAQGGAVTISAGGAFIYTPPAAFVGTDTFTYTLVDALGGTAQAQVTLVLETASNYNEIFGTSGNETLTGTSGDDALYGEGGNDTLKGESGHDVLYGQDGDDILWGNDGDDLFYGGAGADWIKGGNGVDTYIYGSVLDAGDTINDFRPNHGEKLDVSVILNGAPGFVASAAFPDGFLRLEQSGSHVQVYIDPDGNAGGGSGEVLLVTLENADTNDIGLSHFVLPPDTPSGPPNNAPVAQDDAFSGDEDNQITDNVLADNGNGVDTDADSDPLSVVPGTGIATAQGGSVDIAANGDFTYTPPANFSGTDSFTYTLNDGNGVSDTGTVTLNVAPVNDAPMAKNDSFIGLMDEDIGGNLLSDNGSGADSDPDGGTLSVQSGTFATAQGGSVVISSNGTFVYTPATGFLGEDSFEYTLSDGQGGSDTGLATLTVQEDSSEINGTAGDDVLNGTMGADVINGLAGNDTLYGDAGNDTIDGGADTDTVTYASAASGVSINLATGTASDGAGGNDTISNIERAVGSAFADTITGTAGNNILSGGNGNDTLNGNGGDDTLNGEDGDDVITGGSSDDTISGGSGNDTASYANATGAVTVSLSSNTGTGFGTDTLSGIENIIGSPHNDNLTGDGSDNILAGGDGDDTLTGGSGNDTADYKTASSGVSVNLAAGIASGQGTDTLSGIEHVLGSAYADSITGTSGKNNIYGGAGNDNINAESDLDNVYGGAGDDTIYGGENSDTIYGDEGNDIIHGEAGNDIVYGGDGNDTITTGDNNDTIYGGAGNDSIDGGGSNDTVSYMYDPSGIVASLVSNMATDGWGNTDTYTNVERLTGSGYDDMLTGSSTGNILLGGGGSDTIIGNGGTDTISGEDGDDLLSGGSGADTYDGGNGIDTVDYSASVNSVNINLTTGTGSGQGTDTLANIENIIGSSKNDTLRGNSSANTLAGRGGADTMYGEAGADVFLFEAATAYGWTDTLADFSTAQGDKIDISDLLSEYDPLTELIEDFVRITTSGSNSILSVDANGGADSFVQIASITGVTGLTDEQDLVDNGYLLVA